MTLVAGPGGGYRADNAFQQMGGDIGKFQAAGFGMPSISTGGRTAQPVSTRAPIGDPSWTKQQWQQAIAQNPQAWSPLQGMAYYNVGAQGQQQPYMPATGTPPTGLIGSEAALNNAYWGGLGALQGAIGQARGDIAGYGQQGIDAINPYLQEGLGANSYAAALSGALGPEAQAQAYAGYMESPGQQYLREQGERAILRNASATGGLGGGNVLKELQAHGIGLAAQDFDNAYNRLSGLADRGLGAGTNILGAYQGIGSQLGDTALTGGLATADMTSRYGENIATGRTRAGELLSQNIGQTTSALSNLQSDIGQQVAGLQGQQGSNLANLLSSYGINDAQTRRQFMALLGNISTGAGTQVANLSPLPAWQQPGYLTGVGQLLQGAGGLATGIADYRSS